MVNYTGAAAFAAIAVVAVLASGCSTSAKPGTTEARIPGAQNYNVTIQPARIPPNPQGAFALSTATGCDVIYIAKSAALTPSPMPCARPAAFPMLRNARRGSSSSRA